MRSKEQRMSRSLPDFMSRLMFYLQQIAITIVFGHLHDTVKMAKQNTTKPV